MAQARPRVENSTRQTRSCMMRRRRAKAQMPCATSSRRVRSTAGRINHDALKSLFDGDSAGAAGANFTPPEVALSDKEEDVYTIDDKSDGESVCVAVEESGGGLGKSAPAPRRGTDKAGKKRMEDADADGETGMDGEDIEMRKKGDEYARDEGSEQEV
ncbi:hypothetical protein DFH11DRAFT_1644397 [Phellopilus nigrolimitatus]|nr:hypothetical protein DFH11DRAFT_1644397 [Phellopilus nigrolimitatus]